MEKSDFFPLFSPAVLLWCFVAEMWWINCVSAWHAPVYQREIAWIQVCLIWPLVNSGQAIVDRRCPLTALRLLWLTHLYADAICVSQCVVCRFALCFLMSIILKCLVCSLIISQFFFLHSTLIIFTSVLSLTIRPSVLVPHPLFLTFISHRMFVFRHDAYDSHLCQKHPSQTGDYS